MARSLTLGSVRFSGFEVPEDLAIGGEQALVVHKLPGGARIVDAMGADHRDIQWSGRFRGGGAESRARLLDGYRTAGRTHTLTWSGYRYRVVVKSFEARYQNYLEIPYTISCLVIADESAPVAGLLPGIDEVIGAALGGLLGLSGPIDLAAVTASIEDVQTAVDAVRSIKGASKESLASVIGAIGTAQSATQGAIASASATLGLAPPVTAGGNPAAMAAGLAAQAEAFGKLDALYQAAGTLTGMGRNIGSVGN